MSLPPERWPRWGVALLVFAASTYTVADPDLWGHLRFGLDTLQTWSLPSVDPYSFTQDKPWVNHEWLSELMTAAAWTLGGTAGLALLKGLLFSGALCVVWTALAGTRLGVRAAVMLGVGIGTVHIHSSIRPQVWTLLALALLIRALVTDRARTWWLPLLFAVWANSHGGWIVGLSVLVVWAAADVWVDRSRVAGWAATVGASALATLATPYGWRLWTFMLETVSMDRNILEWQPLWVSGPYNWLPWLTTAAVVLASLRWPHPRRLQAYAVLAVLAYASVRVMRIHPLFILSAAVLLSPAFAARWPEPTRPRRAATAAERGAAVYIFLMAAAAAAWVASHSLTCLPILGRWRAESTPVQLLQGAMPGRLVTAFDWGQYALWHLGPRLKVSMDGRRETVYSDATLTEYDALILGEPAGLRALDRWRAEYAWLPTEAGEARRWFEANGYRIEFDSDLSFVAVRADLPPLPRVEGSGDVSSACFPN